MKVSRSVASAALALLLLAPIGTARAQSAPDVLQEALERFEERVADVRDYTVTQRVMGMETTAYFEKKMVEGHPVFRSPETTSQEGGGEQMVSHPYSFFPKIAANARMEGRTTLEGTEVLVVAVEDFSELDLGAMGIAREESDFEPERGTFYIESDRYVLRRVKMEGTARMDGEPRDVTLVADLGDYRQVEGMLYPYRITVKMKGIKAAIPEADRKRLEKLKAQLDSMPEEKRKMVEKAIPPQMRKMMETGEMEFTVEVTELAVNQGPPSKRKAGTGGGGS